MWFPYSAAVPPIFLTKKEQHGGSGSGLLPNSIAPSRSRFETRRPTATWLATSRRLIRYPRTHPTSALEPNSGLAVRTITSHSSSCSVHTPPTLARSDPTTPYDTLSWWYL